MIFDSNLRLDATDNVEAAMCYFYMRQLSVDLRHQYTRRLNNFNRQVKTVLKYRRLKSIESFFLLLVMPLFSVFMIYYYRMGIFDPDADCYHIERVWRRGNEPFQCRLVSSFLDWNFALASMFVLLSLVHIVKALDFMRKIKSCSLDLLWVPITMVGFCYFSMVAFINREILYQVSYKAIDQCLKHDFDSHNLYFYPQFTLWVNLSKKAFPGIRIGAFSVLALGGVWLKYRWFNSDKFFSVAFVRRCIRSISSRQDFSRLYDDKDRAQIIRTKLATELEKQFFAGIRKKASKLPPFGHCPLFTRYPTICNQKMIKDPVWLNADGVVYDRKNYLAYLTSTVEERALKSPVFDCDLPKNSNPDSCFTTKNILALRKEYSMKSNEREEYKESLSEILDGPIGKQRLQWPVTLSTGHTYELKRILPWLVANPICPLTSEAVDLERVKVNLSLYSFIVSKHLNRHVDLKDSEPRNTQRLS